MSEEFRVPVDPNDPKLPSREELVRQRADRRSKYTVGVVWPNGRVSEHVVPPPVNPADEDGARFGADVVAWINGQVAITKRGRALGCMLLADMCSSDGKPELYAHWQEAIHARHHGAIVKGSNLGAVYPPSVLALRASARANGRSGKVFVLGEGYVEASKSDAVASKLKSLGIDTSKSDTEKGEPKKGK